MELKEKRDKSKQLSHVSRTAELVAHFCQENVGIYVKYRQYVQ